MKVGYSLNHKVLTQIDDIAKQALYETAESIRINVQQNETMPFDTGNLQNRSTFVDKSQLNDYKVSIVSDTPYARRLYFHPEYNFSRRENRHAGGKWFDPYIDGSKKDYPQRMFEKFLSRQIRSLR